MDALSWLLPALLAVDGLYQQSVSAMLAARFPSPQTNYIVLDASTGETLASNWPAPDEHVRIGSLIKPFLALRFANPPRLRCIGKQCWLTKSHGELGIEEAIAQSCNSYFRQVLSVSDWQRLSDGWPMPPAVLAQDYRRLATAHDAASVRRGMKLCAREGTGRAAGMRAMLKTGTAKCSHRYGAPIDGYTAALFPEVNPRYVVLVRVHNATGAIAARTMGQMLRVLRDGR